MEIVGRYTANPSKCVYLPDKVWQLEYEFVRSMSPEDYAARVQIGWRRFGPALFRPRCPSCTACQSIRVLVNDFKPDRSQRRVYKANQETTMFIGPPLIDAERIDLYDRHHAHHSESKGWPKPAPGDGVNHVRLICDGPLEVQEWSFFVEGKLVGVSYIDVLPDGFSGIYFFHDPDFRKMSLGTWMVLSIIERAKMLGLPYVYLGYYVKDCRSMEYKARFRPSEVVGANGKWNAFSE